jgi:hypothetical protein
MSQGVRVGEEETGLTFVASERGGKVRAQNSIFDKIF